MAYIKLNPIPGASDKQKDLLYKALNEYIKLKSYNTESLIHNLKYFESWWDSVLDVTIGENTIDVHQLAGSSIENVSLVMYNLASLTGKVITTSFNGVKIIMVDQNG